VVPVIVEGDDIPNSVLPTAGGGGLASLPPTEDHLLRLFELVPVELVPPRYMLQVLPGKLLLVVDVYSLF
jgi:hypothetical protein